MAGRVYVSGPDHWAPMTWPRCVAAGCRATIDPWLHVTRCPTHQADEDTRRERVRAIVAEHRRAELDRRRRA